MASVRVRLAGAKVHLWRTGRVGRGPETMIGGTRLVLNKDEPFPITAKAFYSGGIVTQEQGELNDGSG